MVLSTRRAGRDRSRRLIFARTLLGRKDHAQELGETEARLAQLSQSLAVGPVRIVSLQRDRPAAFATGLDRPRCDLDLRERAAGKQERLGRPLRRPSLRIAGWPPGLRRRANDHLGKAFDRPVADADEPHGALYGAAVPVGMKISALADLQLVSAFGGRNGRADPELGQAGAGDVWI